MIRSGLDDVTELHLIKYLKGEGENNVLIHPTVSRILIPRLSHLPIYLIPSRYNMMMMKTNGGIILFRPLDPDGTLLRGAEHVSIAEYCS